MRLLLTIALVAALAACGGGGGDSLTHAEYQQRVERSLARLNERILALRADATALVQLRRALDQTADRLDALSPPDDAGHANDELIDGLRSFEATLASEEQTIRHARGLEAREALARIARSEGIRRIQRAEADLRRAGYDLPT